MNTIGVVNLGPLFVLEDSNKIISDLIYFDKIIYDVGSRDVLKRLFYSAHKNYTAFELKMGQLDALEKEIALIQKAADLTRYM